MKLIETNNDTVTLSLSREELKDLNDVLWRAMYALEREPAILRTLIQACEGADEEDVEGIIREFECRSGHEEESIAELENSLARAEQLLPRVQEFLAVLRPIVSKALLQRLKL
jgi:uncharacterized coiled-coil protein SlyX